MGHGKKHRYVNFVQTFGATSSTDFSANNSPDEDEKASEELFDFRDEETITETNEDADLSSEDNGVSEKYTEEQILEIADKIIGDEKGMLAGAVITPEDISLAESMTTVETVSEVKAAYRTGYASVSTGLNVRNEPSMDSDIIKVVENGYKFVVDPEKSTDEFWCVCSPEIEIGYCCKRFIRIEG